MPPLGFDKLASQIHDASKCAFGEDVTFEPQAGGSFSIVGIFNEIFEQVDPDTERVISTQNPTLGVKLSDLPSTPKKDDVLKIRGVTYRIYDSQEDGEGMSQLFLTKVS